MPSDINQTIAALSDERTHADLDKRIAIQEVKMNGLTDIVINIRDNHLVHIAGDIKETNDKVDGIKDKLTFYAGGLAVLMVIGTVVIPIILHFIK